MIVVVMPYEALSDVAKAKMTTGNLLALGSPAAEREGVVNRRIAFGHPFTQAELDWVVACIAELPKPHRTFIEDNLKFLDALPADWRDAGE